MKRFNLKMRDGKDVSVCLWEPFQNPVGILCISHGMAEHIMRYNHIAEYLSMNGFVVIGADERAHGKTDEKTLGYSDGNIADLTVDDNAEVIKYVRNLYPDLKLVIFGHSYGSFLTQWFIERHGDLIDGVILGGSAKMTGLIPFAGRMVANIGYAFKGAKKPATLLKKLTFDSYEKQLKYGSFISSIKTETDRYLSDPFCAFVCSYGFYKYFFKAFTKMYKKSALEAIDKNLPLFIISGESDPVGSYTKSTDKLYEMYKKLGLADVTLKYYRGGVRHEYLNDISRKEAFDDILAFLHKICG